MTGRPRTPSDTSSGPSRSCRSPSRRAGRVSPGSRTPTRQKTSNERWPTPSPHSGPLDGRSTRTTGPAITTAASFLDAAGWIVWDKRDGQTPTDQSDAELIWTNFGGTVRTIRVPLRGGGSRAIDHPAGLPMSMHPTQKPLRLMSQIIERCPSGTIIDPYMGSGCGRWNDRDSCQNPDHRVRVLRGPTGPRPAPAPPAPVIPAVVILYAITFGHR